MFSLVLQDCVIWVFFSDCLLLDVSSWVNLGEVFQAKPPARIESIPVAKQPINAQNTPRINRNAPNPKPPKIFRFMSFMCFMCQWLWLTVWNISCKENFCGEYHAYRRRDMNRKKAAQLLREGKRSEARDCLAQCIDITPHMALELMNVSFTVAIYYLSETLLLDVSLISASLTDKIYWWCSWH